MKIENSNQRYTKLDFDYKIALKQLDEATLENKDIKQEIERIKHDSAEYEE